MGAEKLSSVWESYGVDVHGLIIFRKFPKQRI
jgi:hypothetical protein